MFDDSLVDPFVAATDQNDLICFREPQRFGLIERPACGAEHDHFNSGGAVLSLPNRLDRVENRLGFENHSFAAAERPVVDRAMAIRSEIPQVVDSNIDESFFASPANDSEIERALEELGEDRDDIESHLFKSRRSSGKSTSIRR